MNWHGVVWETDKERVVHDVVRTKPLRVVVKLRHGRAVHHIPGTDAL